MDSNQLDKSARSSQSRLATKRFSVSELPPQNLL